MAPTPPWLYDEYHHAGVDYDDRTVAEQYDATHARFRGDMAAEAERLLDELRPAPTDTLIDLGCGTGTFAVQAAKRCAAVHAVGVSAAMLAVAERKARDAGVRNLALHHGGFLTYAHAGDPAGIVTSTAALHHLPDFWKLVGLRRVAAMLRPGGLFYLFDTVYSIDPADYERVIEGKIVAFALQAGDAFGDEAATAFRDEFSTWDWVMEGLLSRAGFEIERAACPDPILAGYRCRRR